MAATTVTMPQLGESVVEGTIVKWLAQPGQRVERDQPLVEVATDKANTEIPSPTAGVLVEQLAKEGATVAVGAALAQLDDGAKATAPATPASTSTATPTPQPQQEGGNGHLRASPVVRNVAQEHGVDLERVQGSGAQGRITKADVMGYIDRGGPVGASSVGLVNVEGSADSSEPAVPAGAVVQPPPPAQTARPTQPPSTIPPPISATGYATGPVPLQLRAFKPPR